MNFVDVARYYTLFMSVMVAAGGIMGFVKAGSKPSLIAGVSSGIVLGILFAVSGTHPKECIIGSLITFFVLDTTFTMRLVKTKKVMPAGLMLVLCLIGFIVNGVAFTK